MVCWWNTFSSAWSPVYRRLNYRVFYINYRRPLQISCVITLILDREVGNNVIILCTELSVREYVWKNKNL